MPAPHNPLKAALARGDVQRGLWLGLGSAAVAELASRCGFDWCLIDAEHGPNDLQRIQAQLQAMNGAPAAPVVRVPVGEDWVLKQVLDLGAQSVLVPMIDTVEQAEAAVAAVRYPPHGRRGMGAALARASGYNAIADYSVNSNAEICLMVQAESRLAIDNIDGISAVEGVDVVFIGPADLSADMGYPGRPDAPEVLDAIDHAIARIRAAGKAPGIIAFDLAEQSRYIDKGVQFLGVGADVTSLAAALKALAGGR